MGKCEQCIVRKLSALNELTKDELIRISHCKTAKDITKGEIIFDEGDRVNGVYCIKSGVCKVSKMSENGRSQIIQLIKGGDMLGQRSLIGDQASNVQAVAVNDMQICFIPRDEIIRDLKSNNAFTMSMLKQMAVNLKENDELIMNLGQKTVTQRLAQTLLYIQETFGENEEGALDISLSREDYANIIGTATESAIRLLSGLKKKGIIQIKKKEIFILDARELQRIIDD